MNADTLRRVAFRGGGLAVILATTLTVGASSFLAPPQPARAMTGLDARMERQIATMSTGEDQAIALSGVTAQERNGAIPALAARTEMLARVSMVGTGSQSYGAAHKCLAQAIYYESAREPQLGMRAVAQVVLNRVRHPAYPNSVCGVVYQGVNDPVCQFSFTCDGALLRTPMREYWEKASAIATRALAGEQVPEVGTATHYHADYVVPRWAYTMGKIGQIGRHIFYRFPGRAGRSGAFQARWAGNEHIPTLDFARLRFRLAAEMEDLSTPVLQNVPGLTVPPDVKDRHAPADVGGRLDTTTGWRLSIPDPVQLSASYRAKLSEQESLVAGDATESQASTIGSELQ